MSIDLLKQITESISSNNPSGTQIEDDPDYEKINAEIQKIGSLHGGTVEWSEVVNAGTNILTQKWKDISVAIWLCMGLFQQQGYKGLGIGFEICLELLDKFWDTMFPPLKRIRGRASSFTWLATRLYPLIKEKQPSQSDAEAIQSCTVNIEKLIQKLDEKFGDNTPTRGESPNFNGLREILQGYALKFKAKETVTKQEATKPAEPRQTSPSTTTATVSTAFTSAENAYQVILMASNYLRESKPNDPIPYKINRVIRWSRISELPLATNGKTELPGFLPQLVQGFQNLLNGKEWETLLKQSEVNFLDSPLWFDIQRFIDRAMTELGPTYENARQAIREELASLVKRLPGILDLQFKNGIPFADSQTKMWIEVDIMPSVASEKAQTQENSKSDETKASPGNNDQIITEAKRIASGGKLEEAISLLKNQLSSSSFGREQFIWRLNIAKFCLEVGKFQLAIPQLESLDEEVKRYSLEQWEPKLAVDVLMSLLQCRRKLIQDIKQPSIEITSLINDLYARLCRLDVLSALTLDSVP